MHEQPSGSSCWRRSRRTFVESFTRKIDRSLSVDGSGAYVLKMNPVQDEYTHTHSVIQIYGLFLVSRIGSIITVRTSLVFKKLVGTVRK
jgi:preprotein translocase subunit Sss1